MLSATGHQLPATGFKAARILQPPLPAARVGATDVKCVLQSAVLDNHIYPKPLVQKVHIHFKLRLFTGSTKTYEFTSQFFFNETLTTTIHALSPYNSKGTRDTLNTSDGIYNSLSSTEKSALTLTTTKTGDTYAGVINLGVVLA